MRKRRVLVVEDHPVFRLGLRELLDQEDDLEVCAEASDIAEAAAALGRALPDVIVTDLSLKGRSGLDLIRDVRERHPGLPVLVVSMYDEALYAERALAAGARGYVMKQETSDSIVQAVRTVLEGRLYLSPRTMADLVAKFVRPDGAADRSPLERLTDRELEVFRLIGQGQTTGEIAATLCLSAKTIGTYRERIKEKLGLRTSAELTLHAMRVAEADRGRQPSS